MIIEVDGSPAIVIYPVDYDDNGDKLEEGYWTWKISTLIHISTGTKKHERAQQAFNDAVAHLMSHVRENNKIYEKGMKRLAKADKEREQQKSKEDKQLEQVSKSGKRILKPRDPNWIKE